MSPSLYFGRNEPRLKFLVNPAEELINFRYRTSFELECGEAFIENRVIPQVIGNLGYPNVNYQYLIRVFGTYALRFAVLYATGENVELHLFNPLRAPYVDATNSKGVVNMSE